MRQLSRNDADSTNVTIDDCWNKIGIHGDGSCPALKEHVHCRNCPIYSTAAVALLDRDIPADYHVERAGNFTLGEDARGQETRSVFIFRIATEWLALPTLVLDEVTELRGIHSLPHRRGGLALGLANVRGTLLVCVSLGKMLRLEEAMTLDGEPDRLRRRRLAVVSLEGYRIAFPFDEAQGIHNYRTVDLRPIPATVTKAAASYTTAIFSWRDKSIGLLDEQRVIHTLGRSIT